MYLEASHLHKDGGVNLLSAAWLILLGTTILLLYMSPKHRIMFLFIFSPHYLVQSLGLVVRNILRIVSFWKLLLKVVSPAVFHFLPFVIET